MEKDIQTIIERLKLLKRAEATHAVEGMVLPADEQRQLRDWVREGLSADEMVERIRAEYL